MNSKKVLLIFAVIMISRYSYQQAIGQNVTQRTLRAGIAKIDITPEIPVMLYGYTSRKTPSEGVHDSLWARTVIFEKDGNKFVLISSDLGSYGSDVFDVIQKSLIKKFKLKESELFLSTIHSHSSPILTLNKENGNPNNIQYTETLNLKLLKVVEEAFNNLKPVKVGVGSGSSPVGSNRREMKSDGSIILGRNPNGPADKEVLVIKIADSEEAPLGALFDYATHSTSLGPRNMMISGDILGLSARFTEKILGKRVISPAFAGASGDIDPWYRVLPGFNTEPGWIPEPVLLGTMLGEEVVTVFRNIKTTEESYDISTSTAIVECPRKKTGETTGKTKGENEAPTVPVNIIVAKLGENIAFVGFNVEMLTEIGLSIKAGSPFRYTFIITHCNGSSGYLPPAGLYKEGGYEVTSSKFEIGAAELVTKKALRMLYDLKSIVSE